MIVGFTGTRAGMTLQQWRTVSTTLIKLGVDSLSHGCCVGADAQAHKTALCYGWHIYGYPGPVTKWSMHIIREEFTWLAQAEPYATRNRKIAACEVLVAAPKGYDLGVGGTGMTVRFARELGRRVIVVLPDGSVR